MKYRCVACSHIVSVKDYDKHSPDCFHKNSADITAPKDYTDYVKRMSAIGLLEQYPDNYSEQIVIVNDDFA